MIVSAQPLKVTWQYHFVDTKKDARVSSPLFSAFNHFSFNRFSPQESRGSGLVDDFSFNAYTMSSIKRIGIVLKPHQPDALRTICELAKCLADRNIELVGGPEIEREKIG